MNDCFKHALLGAVSAVALAVLWGVLGKVTYTTIILL